MLSPPRPLPLYFTRKCINGREYVYFRRKGSYARLPSHVTSRLFLEKYARPLKAVPLPFGTVRAMLIEYRSLTAWTKLHEATQQDHSIALEVLRPILHFQVYNVRRHHILGLRNRLCGTTRQDDFVSAVRRAFNFGIQLGYSDRNPVAKIEFRGLYSE